MYDCNIKISEKEDRHGVSNQIVVTYLTVLKPTTFFYTTVIKIWDN
jgi:hypothetical protein